MSWWTDEYVDTRVTEQGWPGHFVLADQCGFRRNTLIEKFDAFGNCNRFIVSTVGKMTNHTTNKVEKIGLDQYYETLVFCAKKIDGYWEADVSNEIYWSDEDLGNIKVVVNDFNNDTDLEANKMHDDVVNYLCLKLRKGYYEKVSEEEFGDVYSTVIYHPYGRGACIE